MSEKEGFLRGDGELLVSDMSWHYYTDEYNSYNCSVERFDLNLNYLEF